MSDTFYAGNPGESFSYQTDLITVGTSSSSSQALELRVTDGACTRQQVYEFLEKMADYFSTVDKGVVVPGTLKG